MKGRTGKSGTVAWKIDTAPLDLARSAYHIGATAMARGFGYGIDDALHQTGGGWAFGDAALHKRTAPERLQRVLGNSEMLYVPPIHLQDQLTQQPVEWLKREMKKFTGIVEED
jgi:hypothetical protein